ncbi:MAG: hypothetical protein HY064_16165 [Bacteroidetes bacterium]|nr:hypothetical protein [Bacteroidota bacterium]
MKKFILLVFCFAAVSLFSQDRKSLLQAALKNSNSGDSTFLLRDSVLAHLYYDAESDSLLLAGLSDQAGLSKSDIDYMRAQLQHYSAHCWSADSVKNAVIVSSAVTPAAALSPKKLAKAWNNYFSTHKTGYFEMSEPVFSKDGTYAVVYVGFQCGGNCGNGGATLYHWEKGMWKPVKNCFAFEKQPH